MSHLNENKKIPTGYVQIFGSDRNLGNNVLLGDLSDPKEIVTVTIIVKRKHNTVPIKNLADFQGQKMSDRKVYSHEEFKNAHGSAQGDIDVVVEFAKSKELDILETNLARRSVIVCGSAAQISKAFAVELRQSTEHKKFRSYSGFIHLPTNVAEVIEQVIGLDNRPVPARHATADPTGTSALTPQRVAQLYNFPAGKGTGETIGIYEMQVGDPDNPQNPGYAAADLQLTMNGFGGGLAVPVPIDISVDNQVNTGVSDGETVLDITVSASIAQGATIAVYFTGSTVQNILHALQRMIHPGNGDPVPTVISISYGWSPDDDTSYITTGEYAQLSSLFQDAAHLPITVLVSTGDTGAQYGGTQAQASYPATDPWVLACGGTTIGNINFPAFDEYVWNDTFGTNSGATGGGISANQLFPVPAYQYGYTIPVRNITGLPGRGIPDVAGNASPNSGYPLFLQGAAQGAYGGTSAVAPLYAGLIAVINGYLQGHKVGFLNPTLYTPGNNVCRDISSPPGPVDNSFGGVNGYPCVTGWDACTGLGVIDGAKLLASLKVSFGVLLKSLSAPVGQE